MLIPPRDIRETVSRLALLPRLHDLFSRRCVLDSHAAIAPHEYHPFLMWAYKLPAEAMCEQLGGLEESIELLHQAHAGRFQRVCQSLVMDHSNVFTAYAQLLLAAHLLRKGYDLELEPSVNGSDQCNDIGINLGRRLPILLEIYSPRDDDPGRRLFDQLEVSLISAGLYGSRRNYSLTLAGSETVANTAEAAATVVEWVRQHKRISHDRVVFGSGAGLRLTAKRMGLDGLFLRMADTVGVGIPPLPWDKWGRVIEQKRAKGQLAGRGHYVVGLDLTQARHETQLHFQPDLVALINPEAVAVPVPRPLDAMLLFIFNADGRPYGMRYEHSLRAPQYVRRFLQHVSGKTPG